MPTYKELLEAKEWKLKRNAIVKRDTLRCNNCYNQTLLSKCEISHGLKQNIPNTDFSIYFILPIQKKAELNVIAKNLIDAKGKCFLKNENTVLQLNLDTTNILIYHEKLDTDIVKPLAVRTLVKSEYELFHGIPVISNLAPSLEITKNWIYNTTLHVHHKYYKYGLLPWEYPDSALITLCWPCHESLHRNEKVPVFDENGNIIEELTPCDRCSGAGVFPEFHHVYNGICFKCDGARYLELM